MEIEVDDSFCAKKQVQSLKIIFQIVNDQKKKLQNYEFAKKEIEIIGRIRLIANEIYSGCEVINQMLIAIYRNDDRYRGTQLKRGFNDNFKEIYNASVKRSKELSGIYKDKFIFSFFCSAKSWFIELHDIRTQETHYEVGKIEMSEGKAYYINGNRNGTSKQLYTNPSNDIRIEIDDLMRLIDGFLETEDKIASLVKKICNKKVGEAVSP
jgi:hypothetical protein